MALQTKYIETGTNSAEWKCRLVVTENSINNSTNSSSLTLTLQFTRSRSGGYQAWCGYTTSATLAVGGTSQKVSVASFNYSSVGVDDWKTLATYTFSTVYHLGDGTMNASVGAYWSQTYCQPNTCDVSGQIELTNTNGAISGGDSSTGASSDLKAVTPTTTTVYKASSISATSSVAVGSTCSITITKNSSVTLTHTIRYRTEEMSHPAIIVEKTSSTSYSWTVPKYLLSQFTSTSLKCKLYLDTFYSGYMIGTATKSITLTKPTLTTSPMAQVSSTITLNRNLNIETTANVTTINENGTSITSLYAAYTHSHITASGGSLGTTSGGCYIKFDNGLMICWNSYSDSSRTMTSQTANACYGGYSVAFTFPVAFASTPVVRSNIKSTGYSNAQATGTTTTGFSIRHWMNYASSPSSIKLDYIAIGFWE